MGFVKSLAALFRYYPCKLLIVIAKDTTFTGDCIIVRKLYGNVLGNVDIVKQEILSAVSDSLGVFT